MPLLLPVSDVRVLYNSDFSFSQRLYGALDVDLCRVKLHEPLRLVVQQSLLYVRDMVPKPCFLALTRLEEVSCLTDPDVGPGSDPTGGGELSYRFCFMSGTWCLNLSS